MNFPKVHYLPLFVSTAGLAGRLARAVVEKFSLADLASGDGCTVILMAETATAELTQRLNEALLVSGGQPAKVDGDFLRASGVLVAALEKLEYRGDSDYTDRVAQIDAVLHRLNFERRLASLSPNQREAMNVNLTAGDRRQLDACKTSEQRDIIFGQLARAQHMRDCVWSEYLHGVTARPPVAAIIVPEEVTEPALA